MTNDVRSEDDPRLLKPEAVLRIVQRLRAMVPANDKSLVDALIDHIDALNDKAFDLVKEVAADRVIVGIAERLVAARRAAAGAFIGATSVSGMDAVTRVSQRHRSLIQQALDASNELERAVGERQGKKS